jgi:hypothetical protein
MMSIGLMLAAATRTSTSPAPASGSGASANTSFSGPPNCRMTIAFIAQNSSIAGGRSSL